MVRTSFSPEKGNIVWINFNPSKGHEQQSRRPAIVVSSNHFNKTTGLILICPLTSKDKKYFNHIAVEGNKIQGFVMCEQLRSIDYKARNLEFIEKVSDVTMINISNCLQAILE